MTAENITVVAAPLRKQVIDRLRDAIVSFEYAPGERLVERDLCDRFGVSRTVIRESLRHLEAEGLVRLVANHGPVVSKTTPEEARGLFEVREVLEALAARLCAEHSTPGQKKQLLRALSQVKHAYEHGDLPAQLKAKDRFYELLCEGSQNPVITTMLRSIHARVQVLRAVSLGSPGRTERSLSEIGDVVAAIEAGDGELASRLAALHVRNAESSALARLAEASE